VSEAFQVFPVELLGRAKIDGYAMLNDAVLFED
jgi:hypothetical protein